jgi:hypothetical protein
MSSAVGSPLPAFEMAADHNGLILQNGVRVVVRSEFYVSDPAVLDTLTMHSAGASRRTSSIAGVRWPSSSRMRSAAGAMEP